MSRNVLNGLFNGNESEQETLEKQTAELKAELEQFDTDRSSGKREQQVDVYLNFIGQFSAPIEAEPDTEAEEKRAMWREYKRNQREKKKQEQTA